MNTDTGKARWIYVLAVLLILAGSVSSALGRDLSVPVVQASSTSHEDVVAHVYYHDRAHLDQLASILDIWEVNQSQGYVVALLTPAQYSWLEKAGETLVIDQTKTTSLHQPLEALPGQSPDTIPGYDCYRTVEETYATITGLATSFWDLAELIDIGDSWDKLTPDGPDGYDIYALRLTNEQFGDINNKPTFFLMAEIHARELVTAETATRFAEHLLTNYDTDPDITWLLDHYRIYIVTMTNPDGRIFAEQGESWRKNTDTIAGGGCEFPNYGVDLNRNHSFKWGGASTDPCYTTYQGPEPASEPETQIIQNFVLTILSDQRDIGDTDPAPTDTTGLFITLHSYSQLVIWPWGWTDTDAPNHTQLQTLGRRLAYFNDYSPQQANDLYMTTGSSDDWAYGELGVAAYTFEMGTQFFQDCDSFESTIYPDNLQALLYAFKAARLPYMDPAGPRIVDVAVSSSLVAAGEPVTLTASADDDLYNDSNGREPTQDISAARYSIDAPSWMNGTVVYPLNATDGKFNDSSENIQTTIDTTNLSVGKHIIYIEAMDENLNWGVPTAIFLTIVGYDLDVNPLSDYILAPSSNSSVIFYVELTNTGSVGDTFDLTVDSDWNVTYASQIGPLDPDEFVVLEIEVFIPPLASPGSLNETVLTFTSQGDPTVTESVTLYTRLDWLHTLLPILQK